MSRLNARRPQTSLPAEGHNSCITKWNGRSNASRLDSFESNLPSDRAMVLLQGARGGRNNSERNRGRGDRVVQARGGISKGGGRGGNQTASRGEKRNSHKVQFFVCTGSGVQMFRVLTLLMCFRALHDPATIGLLRRWL